jgi:ribosome production factor 2
MRFKNYLIDFFKTSDYEEANINELKRVMVFTCVGDTVIHSKQFEVRDINVTNVDKSDLDLNEVGPRYTLTVRRNNIASDELYKDACKKPKITNIERKKWHKNMYTDEFGQ